MLNLLRERFHPRAAVILGCAMLALAAMSGLLAWLGTLPPRDQLLHLTGQVQELKLRNAATGAFTITLLAAGALYTFEFDNAHRLVGLPAWTDKPRDGRGEISVALDYFEFGRSKKVVDVLFGHERVLSYEEVAGLAAEKAIKDRNSAIGFGIMGAGLISLGGTTDAAQPSRHYRDHGRGDRAGTWTEPSPLGATYVAGTFIRAPRSKRPATGRLKFRRKATPVEGGSCSRLWLCRAGQDTRDWASLSPWSSYSGSYERQ